MPARPSKSEAPIFIQPGAGDAQVVGPSRITFKLGAAAIAGRLSMTEYDVAPNFVAPPVLHWHTKEAWVAYILAGRIAFRLADTTIELGAGGVAMIPPNCPFAWSNPLPEPAKMLCVYTPGGFDTYFRELGAVLAANPGAAVKDLTPKLAPLWAKYGIEKEG
jgi:mannose-6-phosphate isomerase-like protein (cupin superfamily)